jgi:hypothetical protein
MVFPAVLPLGFYAITATGERRAEVGGPGRDSTFASAAKQLTTHASLRKNLHGRGALPRDRAKKVD